MCWKNTSLGKAAMSCALALCPGYVLNKYFISCEKWWIILWKHFCESKATLLCRAIFPVFIPINLGVNLVFPIKSERLIKKKLSLQIPCAVSLNQLSDSFALLSLD